MRRALEKQLREGFNALVGLSVRKVKHKLSALTLDDLVARVKATDVLTIYRNGGEAAVREEARKITAHAMAFGNTKRLLT